MRVRRDSMDINISLLMVTADIISLMLLTIAAISNVVGIVFHYFNWNSGLAPKRLENRKGV